MEEQYEKIKQQYGHFFRDLLKQGKLPLRETEKGFWGIAVLDEVKLLFEKLKLHQYKNFLDLGSGDGRIALLASLFTNATGIEWDKELHDKGTEIKNKLNLNANLIQGDFLNHDLSKYDILFLHPDQHPELLDKKLKKELNGILVIYSPHFRTKHLEKMREIHDIGTPVGIYRRKREE